MRMADRAHPEMLVAVDALGKDFGGKAAVRDVTLTVRPGEIVGLVGANGGGKTTSLRMLAGLFAPDHGSGTVLGVPVVAIGAATRRRIGYMGQGNALYPELSVVEQLRFRAAVHGVRGVRAVIADVAERYGLAPVLDKRCATLSGGWARRVQFAATALARPALLLLDEPTAGLDVATRRDLWRWMEALAAGGCGIVISTHDLVEAERCPSILLYHDGTAQPQTAPAAIATAYGVANLEAAVLKRATGDAA